MAEARSDGDVANGDRAGSEDAKRLCDRVCLPGHVVVRMCPTSVIGGALCLVGFSTTNDSRRRDVSRRTVTAWRRRHERAGWRVLLSAARLKIDNTTVAKAWRDFGVQP